MSETLCTLRTKGGGGGKYTETSLWTNSAPTSSFAAQDVSLSDDISNYKYIKIRFRMSTTNSEESNVIYSSSDVTGFGWNNALKHFGSIDGNPATNYYIARAIWYKNGTTLRFEASYRINAQGSQDTYIIPLEILGLNELDHGVRPTIPYFGANVTGTNTRSAATLKIDTEDYDNLIIGSVTKDSGITVKNAQIRDANNTTIYTINVSNSMQTFDVSNYSAVIIVLDAQGTTAWTSLVANNISLSK